MACAFLQTIFPLLGAPDEKSGSTSIEAKGMLYFVKLIIIFSDNTIKYDCN
jgi:hypothetical protein